MTGDLRPYPEYKDSGPPQEPDERPYFDSLRETRDGYLVTYSPPFTGDLFATLTLVYVKQVEKEAVAQAMEREAQKWLQRYPVALMVTAFDATDNVVALAPIRPNDHLFARVRDKDIDIEWRMLKNDEFPDGPLSTDTLKQVYADIPHRTQADVSAAAYNRARQFRTGKRLLIGALVFWLAVVPAIVAILGWASPILGVGVLIYALIRVAVTALKLLGYIRPSDQERRRREKQRLMEHYYYHCERNPRGFERLKCDNFEEDAIADTRREAESLGMFRPAADRPVGGKA